MKQARSQGHAAQGGETGLARLREIVSGFERLRVLVVGDVILDEYLCGDVERVSPEAPVPVVQVQRESRVLGGAGNVVRNLLALGAEARFCAVVGDDAAGREVCDLLKHLGIEAQGLVRDPGRPTTRKTRVVARSQQMLRYDRESREPLDGEPAARLVAAIGEALPGVSGAIVADYGKQSVGDAVARELLSRLSQRGIPLAVDPKSDIARFAGAALVKPNLSEAEQLSGLRVRGWQDVEALMAALARRLPGSDLAVTRGGAGMVVCEAGGVPRDVPTCPREIFDVQGAGDTSIAALWLARLAGASLYEAAILANAAAGVVVAKSGTATAGRDELVAALPAALAAANAAAKLSTERAAPAASDISDISDISEKAR